MDEVKQDTVEMTIPVEQLEPTHEVDQQGKVKCLTCSQILDNIELFNTHYAGSHGVLPTSDPQEEISDTPGETIEATIPPVTADNVATVTQAHLQPLETPTKNAVGRPCEFCLDRTKIMQKVHLYREYCEGKVDGKMHVPYLQEMCGYDYLDILTTQLWSWVNSETHEAEHAELTNTVKRLMERQELRLLQRTLGVHNPSGAIFQLKANHKYVETEKTMLVGGSNGDNPVKYDINIIPKKKREELEGE